MPMDASPEHPDRITDSSTPSYRWILQPESEVKRATLVITLSPRYPNQHKPRAFCAIYNTEDASKLHSEDDRLLS
ncbi:hypothetical protein TNCV_4381831 [Trichonephila clavipes]|nr:hypothetical protein TNCV_4381831 [Trichonephila clavipes]